MSEMRILTVRQPWASALVFPVAEPNTGQVIVKNVENRAKNVAGAYRGTVAIHAAIQYDERAFSTSGTALAAWWNWYEGPLLDTTRGHIVGVVDLVAVHAVDEVGCMAAIDVCSPWADTAIGTHHLRFENPRPLAEPIPYRGALGLRKLDADTTAAVLAAIA